MYQVFINNHARKLQSLLPVASLTKLFNKEVIANNKLAAFPK